MTAEEAELAALEVKAEELKRTIKEKQLLLDVSNAHSNYITKLDAHIAEMTPEKIQSMVDSKRDELMQRLTIELDTYSKTITDNLDSVKKFANNHHTVCADYKCYHTQPFKFDDWYDPYGGYHTINNHMYDIICKKCSQKIGGMKYYNNTIHTVHFYNPIDTIVFPKEDIQIRS